MSQQLLIVCPQKSPQAVLLKQSFDSFAMVGITRGMFTSTESYCRQTIQKYEHLLYPFAESFSPDGKLGKLYPDHFCFALFQILHAHRVDLAFKPSFSSTDI
ncbi:predicted protein [Sclerotinia sclerotiorum 1980 UF-70]|uniref:Uncharacterized protein n=1 Tax=Sclerotinia sclerotiorum (strain ATCC 18683 / 1980 / Ss-1) TaxID=665079 RepID=A7F264_SCLS1|nr:predicted protein [Sclerotinia sclerotiorum 1980 UF-70]EDN95806.1 predicted protein [Sclerotinia sclerotiorum 1980 UF-70]